MVRKFKHKQTEWTAIQNEFSPALYKLYNTFDAKKGEIAKGIIENSSDWVEITAKQTEEELVGLKPGHWYVDVDGGIFRFSRIFHEGAYGDNYCYDELIEVEENYCCRYYRVEREATPEEIHKALDAIRKHKGLFEGAKVNDVGGEKYIVLSELYYDKTEDILFADAEKGYSVCLYSQGQWVEKVEEPILVTEDGYELYDKNEQIWFVLFNPQDNNYEMVRASYNAIPEPECKKAFYEEENAEAYIERHKPRYNIKDLMFLRQEVKNAFSWYWTEQEIKDAILKTIIHLKNSKND